MEQTRQIWLARQQNLNYMVCFFRPVLENDEFFVKYGEPLGLTHVSTLAASYVFGVNYQPLEIQKVKIFAKCPDKGNLWLSRQRNGSYILSSQKPLIKTIKLANWDDFYVQYGDLYNIRNLCGTGIKGMFGIDINCLDSVRVTLKIVI